MVILMLSSAYERLEELPSEGLVQGLAVPSAGRPTTIAARSNESRRPDPVIDRRGHRVGLAVARIADQRSNAGALERCQSRIEWSASRLTTWPAAAHPRLERHPSGEEEGTDAYRGRSREHCR